MVVVVCVHQILIVVLGTMCCCCWLCSCDKRSGFSLFPFSFVFSLLLFQSSFFEKRRRHCKCLREFIRVTDIVCVCVYEFWSTRWAEINLKTKFWLFSTKVLEIKITFEPLLKKREKKEEKLVTLFWQSPVIFLPGVFLVVEVFGPSKVGRNDNWSYSFSFSAVFTNYDR